MEHHPEGELTLLLRRITAGDREAVESLFTLAYPELRRAAQRQLQREAPGHSLQATALVNEVYLRMAAAAGLSWSDRVHFFRAAAQMMRNLLVDHARAKRSQKRGGGASRVPLDDTLLISEDRMDTMLAVHHALDKLQGIDPRQTEVVVMRYFAGMSDEEIGLVLDVSPRTVKRDWVVAKAWLAAELATS